jgi:hypothetical protein
VSGCETEGSVRVVQFTLKFEQCRCELPEGLLGPFGFCIRSGLDEVPEVTGEFRKFGDRLHAVFILPGWFSATAWKKYLAELMGHGK